MSIFFALVALFRTIRQVFQTKIVSPRVMLKLVAMILDTTTLPLSQFAAETCSFSTSARKNIFGTAKIFFESALRSENKTFLTLSALKVLTRSSVA